MSLSSSLENWCWYYGHKAAPTVYLVDGLGGLAEKEARIVRFVSPADRAGRHRNAQKYTVELMLHSELTYPLGTTFMTQEQLCAAMVADVMERKVK